MDEAFHTRHAGWSGLLIAAACLAMGVRHFEGAPAPTLLPELAVVDPGPLDRAGDATPARPYNVVLISIDTLRADHLSAYGYPRDTSPAVESLAEQSVLFENAFSQSPKTAESHMTLFTGLYPSAHGVRNLRTSNRRLSEDVPTLATLLSRAGYRTIGFHGGGNVDAELGFDQGFETYAAPGSVDAVFSRGAEWISAHEASPERDRPWFLFLHTKVLHDPYRPAPEYAARFVDPAYGGSVGMEAGEIRALMKSGGYWKLHKEYWDRVDPRNPADVQQLRDLYDALIRTMDDQLALFLARLHALGADRETIVVFLSDHGEEFLEHRGFRHATVHHEVLHVPLIVRLPPALRPAGRGARVKATVGLVDVTPTLLELLGLPAPAHLQGRSLAALLRDESLPERAVFSQWESHKLGALRAGRWKYIRTWNQEKLYDLSDDPAEQHDLLAERPDVAEQMRARTERVTLASRRFAGSLARGQSFGLEPETRDQLQALGYLGGGN